MPVLTSSAAPGAAGLQLASVETDDFTASIGFLVPVDVSGKPAISDTIVTLPQGTTPDDVIMMADQDGATTNTRWITAIGLVCGIANKQVRIAGVGENGEAQTLFFRWVNATYGWAAY